MVGVARQSRTDELTFSPPPSTLSTQLERSGGEGPAVSLGPHANAARENSPAQTLLSHSSRFSKVWFAKPSLRCGQDEQITEIPVF
jgi:hypothetical protein